MKKTLFALMALALVCAVALSSCKKKDEDKTKTELITQAKGWILTQANCSPDYRLNNGTWCNTDLLKGGFFLDCEKDDIFYFKENKSFVRDFGGTKCEGESGKDETMGTWAFFEDEAWVRLYMAAYYDFENDKYFELKGIILELDDTTLRLQVPIDETDELAKAKMFRGETYPYKGDFYLTFKVKK